MEVMSTKKIKKSGQQLVEFLLVATFMVIIFGILTEYAYAMSVNNTLNKGLKIVASSIYSQIKPGMTKADIDIMVNDDLKAYMQANNAPVQPENNLRVISGIAGTNAAFLATYTYVSAFTLPHVFFYFLPDKFNFTSETVVPAAFLKPNNYPAVDSIKLDKIWSATASFSSLDEFNASKNGIMKDAAGSNEVVFLLPANIGAGGNTYEIVSWSGPLAADPVSGDKNLYVDLTTFKIYIYDAGLDIYKIDNTKTFASLVSDKSQFFIYYDFLPSDMTDLGNYWRIPTGGALADSGTQGILKMALALVNKSTNLSSGNYDNINVSGYNSDVSISNDYKRESLGSYILIHSSTDSFGSLVSGFASSKTYPNFGSKVNKS